MLALYLKRALVISRRMVRLCLSSHSDWIKNATISSGVYLFCCSFSRLVVKARTIPDSFIPFICLIVSSFIFLFFLVSINYLFLLVIVFSSDIFVSRNSKLFLIFIITKLVHFLVKYVLNDFVIINF